jgi:hypothetical protein
MPTQEDIVNAAYEQFMRPSLEKDLLGRSRPFPPDINIHAIGIGWKSVGGTPRVGTVALCFFVAQKLPQPISAADGAIPTEFMGLPTDVLEVPFAKYSATTELKGGLQIAAHNRSGYGTLGAVCVSTDPADPPNARMLLTNWHVATYYGVVNQSAIVHPRGQTLAGQVATTHRFISPLSGFAQINDADAAIAKILDQVPSQFVQRQVGSLALPLATPTLDMLVSKVGAATDLTHGRITHHTVIVPVQSPPFAGGTVHVYRNQLRIQPISLPFSDEGDSGSLVFATDTKQPVALLFAVHDPPVLGSYAAPLAPILEQLRVSLTPTP